MCKITACFVDISSPIIFPVFNNIVISLGG